MPETLKATLEEMRDLEVKLQELRESKTAAPEDEKSAETPDSAAHAPDTTDVKVPLEDDDVPWEEGERYARLWPDARLLTTTGLGHHRIAGDATVIDATLRFLRGEAVGERVVSSPNLPFGFA